jgi:hypothetical protein
MLAHCKAAAEMHKLEKELTGAEPFLVVVVAEKFERMVVSGLQLPRQLATMALLPLLSPFGLKCPAIDEDRQPHFTGSHALP